MLNKIDFCGVISVNGANPNGDPIGGDSPRTDFDGHGVISDVCLKRKIRDRLEADGHPIFVSRRCPDGYTSLLDRLSHSDETAALYKSRDRDALVEASCNKWIDVRAFGQIFATLKPRKNKKNAADEDDDGNISANVRGAVTIGEARSVGFVSPRLFGIASSFNATQSDQNVKESSSMGRRWAVDYSAYVFYGSIFPQLAQQSSLSETDVDAIKSAILRMMDGDASARRPSGSMSLSRLWWWQHNSAIGQYSPAKVFRTLSFSPSMDYPYFTVEESPLPGLTPEVLEGW